MSTIGTGIAAGVANAGTTARTQAATQSSRDAQRADSQQQTDKITLTQLHDASATRDTDEDMPDGQAPGYEDLYEGGAEKQEQDEANSNDQIHEGDAPHSSPTNLPMLQSYDPAAKDLPLFHKLNVKA